jgi:hypothetical protein
MTVEFYGDWPVDAKNLVNQLFATLSKEQGFGSAKAHLINSGYGDSLKCRFECNTALGRRIYYFLKIYPDGSKAKQESENCRDLRQKSNTLPKYLVTPDLFEHKILCSKFEYAESLEAKVRNSRPVSEFSTCTDLIRDLTSFYADKFADPDHSTSISYQLHRYPPRYIVHVDSLDKTLGTTGSNGGEDRPIQNWTEFTNFIKNSDPSRISLEITDCGVEKSSGTKMVLRCSVFGQYSLWIVGPRIDRNFKDSCYCFLDNSKAKIQSLDALLVAKGLTRTSSSIARIWNLPEKRSNVCHGDLHAGNILLTNGQVKLIDFETHRQPGFPFADLATLELSLWLAFPHDRQHSANKEVPIETSEQFMQFMKRLRHAARLGMDQNTRDVQIDHSDAYIDAIARRLRYFTAEWLLAESTPPSNLDAISSWFLDCDKNIIYNPQVDVLISPKWINLDKELAERDHLQMEISQTIRNSSHRLIFITGARGSGKSTLLRKVLQTLCLKQFADFPFHSVGIGEFDTQQNMKDLFRKLFDFLGPTSESGITENATESELAQEVAVTLEKNKVLVVLDGIEADSFGQRLAEFRDGSNNGSFAPIYEKFCEKIHELSHRRGTAILVFAGKPSFLQRFPFSAYPHFPLTQLTPDGAAKLVMQELELRENPELLRHLTSYFSDQNRTPLYVKLVCQYIRKHSDSDISEFFSHSNWIAIESRLRHNVTDDESHFESIVRGLVDNRIATIEALLLGTLCLLNGPVSQDMLMTCIQMGDGTQHQININFESLHTTIAKLFSMQGSTNSKEQMLEVFTIRQIVGQSVMVSLLPALDSIVERVLYPATPEGQKTKGERHAQLFNIFVSSDLNLYQVEKQRRCAFHGACSGEPQLTRKAIEIVRSNLIVERQGVDDFYPLGSYRATLEVLKVFFEGVEWVRLKEQVPKEEEGYLLAKAAFLLRTQGFIREALKVFGNLRNGLPSVIKSKPIGDADFFVRNLCIEAKTLVMHADFGEAEEVLRIVGEILAQRIDDIDPGNRIKLWVAYHCDRLAVFHWSGQWEKAEQAFTDATRHEPYSEENQYLVADRMVQICEYLIDLGRFEEANRRLGDADRYCRTGDGEEIRKGYRFDYFVNRYVEARLIVEQLESRSKARDELDWKQKCFKLRNALQNIELAIEEMERFSRQDWLPKLWVVRAKILRMVAAMDQQGFQLVFGEEPYVDKQTKIQEARQDLDRAKRRSESYELRLYQMDAAVEMFLLDDQFREQLDEVKRKQLDSEVKIHHLKLQIRALQMNYGRMYGKLAAITPP